MNDLKKLFDLIDPIIQKILESAKDKKYQAMYVEIDQSQFSIELISYANHIFVLNILERIQITSLISLARMQRWFSAMILCREAKNYLGYCASLRGLLESSSDSHDTLYPSLGFLDMRYELLLKFLIGHEDVRYEIIKLYEIEDQLIHFSHARRVAKGEQVPNSHNAKTTKSYMENFQNFGVENLINLYAELCEITHPAAASVNCFFKEVVGGGPIFNDKEHAVVSFEEDEFLIHQMEDKYSKTIYDMIDYVYGEALLCLSINAMYPYENLKTPADIKFWEQVIGHSPVWQKNLQHFLETYPKYNKRQH